MLKGMLVYESVRPSAPISSTLPCLKTSRYSKNINEILVLYSQLKMAVKQKLVYANFILYRNINYAIHIQRNMQAYC